MIALPVYAPLGAAAATLLAPRLPLSFEAGGMRLVAAFEEPAMPPLPAAWPVLPARIGAGRAALTLDPRLLPEAAVTPWPAIGAVGAPEDLRDLLRAVLLDDISALVEERAGLRPEWDSGPANLPHAIILYRDEPGRTPLGRVRLDDQALHWLAGCLADLPARQAEDGWLPVTCALRLDRLTLTARELCSLSSRDVVLLDRSPVGPDGTFEVQLAPADGAGFLAWITGRQLEILMRADVTMDSPEPPPPLSLDDLPLTVECDVGRLTLPLARLREMAPGQVLELDEPATGRVTLRVNGQAVATGELVRIAERVGVRIASLLLPARGAGTGAERDG